MKPLVTKVSVVALTALLLLSLAVGEQKQKGASTSVAQAGDKSTQRPPQDPAESTKLESITLWGISMGQALPSTINDCPVIHPHSWFPSYAEADHTNGRICIDRTRKDVYARMRIWNLPYEDNWLDVTSESEAIYALRATLHAIKFCNVVYDALEKKLGKPTKQSRLILQNRFGATWPEDDTVWLAADGASVSYSCSDVDDEGESLRTCHLLVTSAAYNKQLNQSPSVVQP